jgi:hypothetical protein
MNTEYNNYFFSTELLAEIFSHLGKEDILACFNVCKHWRTSIPHMFAQKPLLHGPVALIKTLGPFPLKTLGPFPSEISAISAFESYIYFITVDPSQKKQLLNAIDINTCKQSSPLAAFDLLFSKGSCYPDELLLHRNYIFFQNKLYKIVNYSVIKIYETNETDSSTVKQLFSGDYFCIIKKTRESLRFECRNLDNLNKIHVKEVSNPRLANTNLGFCNLSCIDREYNEIIISFNIPNDRDLFCRFSIVNNEIEFFHAGESKNHQTISCSMCNSSSLYHDSYEICPSYNFYYFGKHSCVNTKRSQHISIRKNSACELQRLLIHDDVCVTPSLMVGLYEKKKALFISKIISKNNTQTELYISIHVCPGCYLCDSAPKSTASPMPPPAKRLCFF